MPVRRQPKVGAIVEVRFDDHCEDGDAIPCIVWGRLTKRDRKCLTIVSWEADGSDYNEKRWTIVRKAVTSIVELKPVRL